LPVGRSRRSVEVVRREPGPHRPAAAGVCLRLRQGIAEKAVRKGVTSRKGALRGPIPDEIRSKSTLWGGFPGPTRRGTAACRRGKRLKLAVSGVQSPVEVEIDAPGRG